jgi:hypothetical protein
MTTHLSHLVRLLALPLLTTLVVFLLGGLLLALPDVWHLWWVVAESSAAMSPMEATDLPGDVFQLLEASR